MKKSEDNETGRFVIDSLDREIIDLLENNCCLSYEELSKKINRNLWTIRDRVVLLKRRGIIRGCRADIDFPKIGSSCRAVISFNVPEDKIDSILNFSRGERRIKRTIVTTGQRRFTMEIIGDDCSEIREYARKSLPKFGIYDVDFEVVLDEILPQA